ncbi:MAG: hypothetical protein ACJ768_10435 [Gaiellaceae bacterium]
MTKVRTCLLALLTASAIAIAPGQAHAQSLDDACDQASPSAATCIGTDKLAEAAAAECRRAGVPDSDCTLPLGHEVAGRMVTDYQGTWVHRAAVFQYALGDSLPLGRTAWLGTHNSFNSVNESPTPSHTDSNQQLSLTQQLDVDIRSLELDLHFFPSLSAGGSKTVVVCHARGPDEENLGCTDEPTFAQVLPQIATWLKAHPSQVLLLYLEDELGDPGGYAQAIGTLNSVLRRPDGSSMIYRPSASQMTAKGCANLPLGVSRDDIRARGAQVVIVGNCQPGWASDVYSWDDNHVESGSTPGYRAFPACDATYPRAVYDSKLVRYYEDSTFVSAATDPTESPSDAHAQMLTPERVADMTRCGVNLFGFDQLLPEDGRIAASIWSWADGQPDPSGGDCAAQGADGRWLTRSCQTRRSAACRTATGWTVTPHAVPFEGAASACRASGASFDLPRTGYENSQLRQATGAGAEVWLRYSLR